MKKILIFLDDERKPFKEFCDSPFIILQCKNYQEAVEAAELALRRKREIYVSLDHDLGEEKTGYDFCKWLVENEVIVKYRLHTMNNVGKHNMDQLLSHYGYQKF